MQWIGGPLSGERLLKSVTDQSDILMTSSLRDLFGKSQLCN